MRLKLDIISEPDAELDVNYYYQLSSAIYLLLKFGSEEFSTFLHDVGYQMNGKTFKMFTFALQFRNMVIDGSKIKMISNHATLFISAPYVDEFIKTFVVGTFNRTHLNLNFATNIVKFKINSMELQPIPNFNSEMDFKLFSPIVLSVKRTDAGINNAVYLRGGDVDEVSLQLTKNLRNKFSLINKKDFSGENLSLKWDENYLKSHRRITKKITINPYGKNPIDIIGMFAPFKLCGSPELIRVGYETGFGEKNSMGFGMAEIINVNKIV